MEYITQDATHVMSITHRADKAVIGVQPELSPVQDKSHWCCYNTAQTQRKIA